MVGESGFSGLGFIMGSLTGLRAFGITRDGWLTGVTFARPWKPNAVNDAYCLRDVPGDAYGQMVPIHRNLAVAFWGSYYTVNPFVEQPAEVPKPLNLVEHPEHKLKDCQCGFWSYFGTVNNYGASNRLSGAIEGFGRIYAGTRGYRCTRARLLALHIPPLNPDSDNEAVRDLAAIYRRVIDRYQVPTYDTEEALVAAYPPDTYEAVRDARRITEEAA